MRLLADLVVAELPCSRWSPIAVVVALVVVVAELAVVADLTLGTGARWRWSPMSSRPVVVEFDCHQPNA